MSSPTSLNPSAMSGCQRRNRFGIGLVTTQGKTDHVPVPGTRKGRGKWKNFQDFSYRLLFVDAVDPFCPHCTSEDSLCTPR